MTKNLIPLSRRFALSCISAFVCLFAGASAVHAAGTISGTVYTDYNMNGVRNTTGTAPNYAVDGGFAGVTVTVYAPNGASKTAVTSASGAYSINTSAAPALPAGPYRVEFTGYGAAIFPSAVGSNNGSTVRFVADGGSTGIDLGVVSPKEFCQTAPLIAINSYGVGTNSFPSIVTFPYKYSDELDGNINGTVTSSPTRDNTLAPSEIANTTVVGATFGLSFNNLTGKLYAGSYLKRGAQFGPLSSESTGAVYQVSGATSGSPVTTVFADLNSIFGANTAGANPHPAASTPDWTTDNASIPLIGKVGLGGVKLSLDGSLLYVVNLADKKLYVLPTSGALNSSTVNRFDIPTTSLATGGGTCATSDVRPFAVGRDRGGRIYVGAVCSAETEATNSKLYAYVWRFDNPGFTLVAGNSLTFPRLAAPTESAAWNKWSNTTAVMALPAPVLTDIDFDGTDIILGIRDRHGDQVVLPDFYRGYGDIMRVCLNAGSYVFENNGGCGSATTTGAGNGSGNGGGEFFIDLNGDDLRDEGALGGVSQIPGYNHMITSFYDAVSYNSAGARMNNFFTSGVQRYSNSTGLMTGAYDIYLDADGGTFGKADGAGDTEVLCELPPLQIGNRVWADTNVNGIQDSGETGISGVALELWADTNSDTTVDTLVGTTTTDAAGGYIFGGADKSGMSTFACSATGTVDKHVNNVTDDAEQIVGTGVVSTADTVMDLTANGTTTQIAGVRFFDLNIPAGATITNAYIEFTSPASGTVSRGTPSITIRTENTDNSTTFNAVNNDLSSRATSSTSVVWTPGTVATGVKFQTPSLATLVQSMVNRTGWASGNSMSFILSGSAGNNYRRAQTIEGGGTPNSARLVVEWSTVCKYEVSPNTKYEVRIPASNFGAGQPLNGRSASPADRDLTPNGDTRDADGAPSAGNIVATLTTGAAGQNNHTYDFGFYATPTAANGSIDGLVLSGGSGVRGVTVVLSGGRLKEAKVVTTNSFGRYSFGDLPVGETYLVTVQSTKKFYFPNPNLVFNLQDNISDANFETGPESIFSRSGVRK